MDPAVDSTVSAGPRRQVCKAASPIGQVAETALDAGAHLEEIATKPRRRILEDLFGAHATCRLWTMSMATVGTIAARRHELQIAARLAKGM